MNTTLTARGGDDVLAAVPVVLGFHPTDSLVMLVFEARKPFHARLDLPESPDDDDEAAAVLLEPCLRHGVGQVVLVAYTPDAFLAGRVCRHVCRVLRTAGIEVVDVLRADGDTWWQLARDASEVDSAPQPRAEGTHPFAAQAVFSGLVTHASREELRASLDPLPERVADTRARQLGWAPPTADDVRRRVADLAALAADPSEPSDDLAARLLWVVEPEPGCLAALATLTREQAVVQLRLWTGLLRRAPESQVPSAAMLVAFAAWLSGHGALAWCALDRCLAVDPGHTGARLLGTCLTRAVPPSVWGEVAGRLSG